MFDRMNKQIIISQLSNFDIDEVEAKIYLHLLEKGPQKPLELSRDININRSRIYRYIDKLMAKKLIEVSNVDRGKRLQASRPENLELLIHEKEQEIKLQKENLPDILKTLSNLPTGSKKGFEVRHYHGTDGLKQMLWNHLAAKKEILVFGYENRNDIAGKAFAETIRFEQVRRKITKIEIENATDQGNYWYTSVSNWGKYYKSRFIPPRILNIRQYQVIFNDTISIMNWADGNKVGVEITNAAFAGLHRQIFWKFWDIAGGYIEEGKRLEASEKTRVR
jgi:sugar-specific transcriptional regulator TrmB